jgi:hypothetical protein
MNFMNIRSSLGVTIGIILVAALVATTTTTALESQYADAIGTIGHVDRKAPTAVSGDNIYIAWWTNKTGNDEVMFRVSNDAGATFGDKINLSNTTSTDSVDVQIATDGGNVVVTWWEQNQTSNEPAARISTDNGLTFGPILKLGMNGTIGTNT